MARGTIHTVDDDIFLIEAPWPERSSPEQSSTEQSSTEQSTTEQSRTGSAGPGCAVVRLADRLFLLDTGDGPELRSAVRAVVASFGRRPEITLVNSGGHPGLNGNNDLLDSSIAGRRRHLLPAAARNDGCAEQPADVPIEDLRPEQTAGFELGGTPWTGWALAGDDVLALEATRRSGRLGFYLPDRRVLLLPDELAAPRQCTAGELADRRSVSARVLRMLDSGAVDVLWVGFGPPLDPVDARRAMADLLPDGARVPGGCPTGRRRRG